MTQLKKHDFQVIIMNELDKYYFINC